MKKLAVAIAIACLGLPVAGAGTADASDGNLVVCIHLVVPAQLVNFQALPPVSLPYECTVVPSA